jgi:hypothetical protein
MLEYLGPIMVDKFTRVLCPGCKTCIGYTVENIREGDEFYPELFEFTHHIYEEGDEPSCFSCGTEWISEEFGLLLETGWFPSRH